MPGQIYTIYTQFDQKFMPGRISNSTGWFGSKSIEIKTTKFNQACNIISMNLLPNRPASISVNLHNLHPIWPEIYARSNSTGQISNLTGHEILVKLGVNSWIYTLVKLGIIPMNLLPFWAVFHARSNLTGHEILLKLGWNSWIYTQFEQYFRPGWIG